MSQQQPPPQNTTVVVMAESPEANIAIRAAWFVFAGWWMSFWAISAAALLQLTIIGIPAAVWIVNRIPQVSTLKSSRRLQVADRQAGVTVVSYSDREQLKWWVRAIYYILVGWWATGAVAVRRVVLLLHHTPAPDQLLDVRADRQDPDPEMLGATSRFSGAPLKSGTQPG